MFALLIRNGAIYGYKEVEQEEADELQAEHVLVNAFPTELQTVPEGHYAIVNDDLTISYKPFDPKPKSEIELLREENADLKSRMDDLEMFAADIISGGGI